MEPYSTPCPTERLHIKTSHKREKATNDSNNNNPRLKNSLRDLNVD